MVFIGGCFLIRGDVLARPECGQCPLSSELFVCFIVAVEMTVKRMVLRCIKRDPDDHKHIDVTVTTLRTASVSKKQV